MKLVVFVAFVACLFQAYHAAPIAESLPSGDAEIRSELEKLPGMDEQMIQTIINVLNKYENDPLALITLALQGDTCVKNRIDLMRILITAFTSDVEEKIHTNERSSIANLLFTEKELEVIEAELGKTLTPEKVQNAMKVLRGFQIRDSGEEKKLAAINLVVSAGKAVTDGCPTEITENAAKQ